VGFTECGFFNEIALCLVYLDPPFFSNRNYEVIWGDEGKVRSFRDRWSGGWSIISPGFTSASSRCTASSKLQAASSCIATGH
jgi:hypothetical protein